MRKPTRPLARRIDERQPVPYQQRSPEPVFCTENERCRGCPYPAHGVICWHRDGTCLRTDIPQCADGEEQVTREGLVAEILSYQCSDGGWALMGDESDVDMTAMALTSLAPYQEETDVKAAVDAALTYLSDAQQADGGFMSWGAANSESCAQVIVALTALGIDPAADSRFVKNGASPLDGLCAFACEGGGFRHSDEQTEPDGMATEQGFYALAAYDRFRQGQTRLFDMTDIEVK